MKINQNTLGVRMNYSFKQTIPIADLGKRGKSQ
jgi:hypothetical protein